MALVLMQDAFPDFPAEEVPDFIRVNWDDTSYRNDLCPSFSPAKCEGLQLWVNRLNPADRYDGPEAPRFNLAYDSDGGNEPCFLYIGDDEAEMLATVQSFYKGMGL